ncbi:MAG: amidophosphoribosyltransferase [Bacteroidales bacterium]|nr:amidophosphoribosyltransferase [Lentimicrobiaceae bacterium]MDD5695213.1 amidophosphoribosyltransferase [Bacteroidales bacterium]
MSESIKHECGIALIRLLKPLEYYIANYGTAFYGFNKLHLLMEKQHNRGQDGAGIACVKFNLEPGHNYIDRSRSDSETALHTIFSEVYDRIQALSERSPERLLDVDFLKYHFDFAGELYLGHLRYGTFGRHGLLNVHPVQRYNNWKTRNLVLAGNFNLTNVDDLFEKLVGYGQYPVETSDTVTILENIGHFLDDANEELYRHFKELGYFKKDITVKIAENLDLQKILANACAHWDGGYVIGGMLGHGDAFVVRDPAGIRPAFYYRDDEVVVATSERPVIQTAFNVQVEQIRELQPGHALIIKANGSADEVPFMEPLAKKACSFERIYFSRGTDVDIYQERKKLGKALAPAILKAVDHDLENTVFSYIPNTAIDAFMGLMEELNAFCDSQIKDQIMQLGNNLTREKLDKLFTLKPRIEKVAVKDIKLRTFISQESHRDDLVTHVYDITYGTVRRGLDNLVVVDDSIVRGTTLRQSIIRILDRLGPKRIIIASSAPQIRYPDCYGIDMARINDFIAFQAAIQLLKDKNMSGVINHVYKKAKEQEKFPQEKVVNVVKEIYRPFTAEQISEKVSQLLITPALQAEVRIIYQTIEDLHQACPNHTGDWYFTGNYPTPGGNKIVNKAFIYYIEGIRERPY